MTIYSIYTSKMVPLAQMLNVLHFLVTSDLRLSDTKDIQLAKGVRASSKGEYMKIRTTLLNALHLVNCALQGNPTEFSPETLSEIAAELNHMVYAGSNLLDAWATEVRATTLVEALSNTSTLSPSAVKHSFRVKSAFFAKAVEVMESCHPHISALHRLIGYTANEHQEWIASRTRTYGPLVQGGRLNYWLTLARNMPLQPMLAKLGVDEPIPCPDTSSTEGKLRLAALLSTLPGSAAAGPVKTTEIISRSPTLIPSEVSIEVKDGKLELSQHVRFPQAPQDHSGWGSFVKAHHLFELDKTATVLCSADKLVKGLDALSVIVSTLQATNNELVSRFEQEVQVQAQSATYEKLKATFSKEELAQLKDYFNSVIS